jgi:hydroxymethylbilane synthase
MAVLRVGTRQSALALAQARQVQSALAERGVASELITFTTVGDKRLDQPLHEIGAKGLFTKELEVALEHGTIDCAVHSLKDLPTASPPELKVVAVLPREDPRDVLVVGPAIVAIGLDDLPHGSRVGTSSLRRRAQLAARRPDLDVVELRGNVPTRLRKVDDGQVHAAVLAAAGLLRLDARSRITAYLEPPDWLPAPGQGAIAIQVRTDDRVARETFGALNDDETMIAVTAEREMLAGLEGGCQVPIGALTMHARRHPVLYGMIASINGREIVRGHEDVDPADPAAAGQALARHLRANGGAAILEALQSVGRVPAPQPE